MTTGWTSAASAAISPLDAVIPDQLPVPTAGLAVWWPGGARVFSPPKTTWTVENGGSVMGAAEDIRLGVKFSGIATDPHPRVVVKMPSPLLPVDVNDDLGGSGATVALWYSAGADKDQSGWNPLIAIGDDVGGENWKWALVLKNGVPLFARRNNNELLVPAGIPTPEGSGGGGLSKVDDGSWHHLVVRLARPGCWIDACPNPGKVLLTMWVDGVQRGETLTDVATDTSKVFFGWIGISGQGFNSQTNYHKDNKRLLTRGAFQDILIYRAALSITELATLRAARANSLVAQFPPIDAKLLFWNGPVPQMVPDAPASGLLSTPSSQAELNLTAVAATDLTGVAYGKASTERAAAFGSVALWLRLPGEDKPGDLFSVGKPPKWIVYMTKDHELGLRCATNGDTSVGQAGPGAAKMKWAANSWHLVEFRWTPASYRVLLDQSLVVDQPVSFCKRTGPNQGGEVTLSRPADVPLAWGGEWIRTKTADGQKMADTHQIAELASPGPAVWLHGDKLVNANPTTPVTASNVSKTFSANNPVGQGAPRSIEIDVSKHVLGGGRGHGSTEATPPYTISMKFRITSLPLNYMTSLLRRTHPAGGYETDLQIWCDNVNKSCALCLYGPPTQVAGASVAWCIDKALKENQDYRVTITSPVAQALQPAAATGGYVGNAAPTVVHEPMVVINGESFNRRYTNDPVKLLPEKVSQAVGFKDGQAGGKWLLGIVDNDKKKAFSIEFSDVRLYGYAILDGTAIGANCTDLDCQKSGKNCAAAKGKFGGICTGCAYTSLRVGGTTEIDAQCDAKVGFLGKCLASTMCASALCSGGLCTAQSADECNSGCKARGRSCATASSAWTCGACLPGFEAAPGVSTGTGKEYSCGWSPKKKGWQTCATDAECTSGACRDVAFTDLVVEGPWYAAVDKTEPAYKKSGSCSCDATCPYTIISSGNPTLTTPTASTRRCLMNVADGESCGNAPLYAATSSTETITRPDGTKGQAETCAVGRYGECKANYQRSAGVLDPGRCYAAHAVSPQEKKGQCYFNPWYKVGSGCKCTDYSDISVADTDVYKAFSKTNPDEFGLNDLKLIFMNDTSPYKPSDYATLVDLGVGRLLIAYAAGNAAAKEKLQAQYGKFLPVSGCGGQYGATAYKNESNAYTCEPKLQPDGAPCPPPGEAGAGALWCRSTYCGRHDGKCQRGDNPLVEIAGNAGNQNRQGKSAVKFGVVRVDDTQVTMEDGDISASAKSEAAKDIRYMAQVNQGHVACVLGVPFPPMPLFETRIKLDRTQGVKCATSEFRTFIMGIGLTSPKPSPVTGSCTGYQASVNTSGFDMCNSGGGNCTPVAPENLSASSMASMLIPSVSVCLPLDEMGVKLPEMKKDFKEALVPLVVAIGLSVDACLSFSVGMDGQGLPQMQVSPSVSIGAEARGGVGIVDGETGLGLYEFSAGIRLALTLVGISFPITWSVKVSDAVDSAGKVVLGMFKVAVVEKISVVLDILSGTFGLYARFSIGPFGFGWTFPIFDWTGFIFNFDISEVPLWSTTLDFRAQFLKALAGAAKATCDAGATSPCYK